MVSSIFNFSYFYNILGGHASGGKLHLIEDDDFLLNTW